MDYIEEYLLEMYQIKRIFRIYDYNILEHINKIFPDFIKLPISIILITSISCI